MHTSSANPSQSRAAWSAALAAAGVFGFGTAITALVYLRVERTETRQVDRVIVLEADRINRELEESLQVRAKALIRMADRWEIRGSTPEREWQRDVGNLTEDLVGFKAINWVDDKNILRWIAPVRGTRHLVGTQFGNDPIRREALQQARATHKIATTPLLPLLLGGQGFVMVVPLTVGGWDDGFIMGVFDLDQLLALQVPKDGYKIILTDERTGQSIRTPGDDAWVLEHAQTKRFDYLDYHWKLEIIPSDRVVGELHGAMPTFTLILGILLSLIVSLLVYMLRNRQSLNRRLQSVLADVSLYKFALDNASMVAFKDAENDFTYVNEKFCETSGYAIHELIGQNHEMLDVIDAPTSARPEIRATLAAGRTWQGEISQRAKDGRVFWCDAIVVPRIDSDGKVYQYISIRRDITMRKELERQFERMVENLPAGAMLLSEDRLFMNRTLENLTGYSRDEVRSLDRWFELMFGDRAHVARAEYARVVASGFEGSSVVPARMKSGETRFLEFVGGRDGGAEIWLILDVTEKVAAQERFELVFKHSVDGQLLLEVGPLGIHILDANPAAVEMVRAKSKADLVGRSPLDFSPESQRDSSRGFERLEQFRAQISFERITQFEWERARLDGTVFPVRVSLSPIKLDGRLIILSTWHDLTAEKASQAKLVQSSKMLSLGEMAGGLAHELNTPLATIKGKVQHLGLLSDRGAIPKETLRSGLAKVEETVDRISRIVGGLRSFSGEGDRDEMVPQGVASIVDDALAFCESRIVSQHVELRIDVPSTLQVSCRPWQVTQAILNLMNNAFDAVVDRDDRWIEVRARDVDGRIEIRVSDSGPGIPLDLRTKIMQPFFTTKAVGNGTGLGLSVAKGIVESHAGTLELDEACPETCFVIRLPTLA